MKKNIILLLLILLYIPKLFCQTEWVSDLKFAKALAIQKDQLILVDFAADWCGPCKAMDKKMWNTPELAELSKNFIALKINIDYDNELATKFNVTSIPRVIIMTANEDIIWDQMGFRSASPYISVMENIPDRLNGLNKLLLNMDQENSLDNMKAGLAFQDLARKSNNDFSRNFLNTSDKYFKVAKKTAETDDIIFQAELNELLNDAIKGKHDRALKKIEKIDLPKESQKLSELKSYIIAYCYKCENNEKAFEAEKSKITNEEYLERLN